MNYVNEKEIELTKKLKEKEEYISKLEGVLFSMPVGILLVNKLGEVIKVNKHITDLVLKGIEDIIGEKGGDVFSCINNCGGCGNNPNCSECGLKQAVENTLIGKKSIRGIEACINQRDGQKVISIWLKIDTQYVEIQGEDMVILMVEDITDQHEKRSLENYYIEKEQELIHMKENNRMKDHFLANISHELKTPLNIVFGIVQVLDNKIDGEKKTTISKRYLRIMKKNCYRLIKLINNLIDITKFDQNNMKMNISKVNIVDVVENITQAVANVSKVYGIETVFDTEEEEIYAAIDQSQIERVVLNLLSNAIKFTGRNGIIHVDIEKDNQMVLINVADTGRGIHEENIEKMFEKFEQADTSLTRDREGSGIGLAIVKSIVEAHEGRIEVDSCVGVGSNFKIFLPIQREGEKGSFEDYIKPKTIDSERIKLEFSDIYEL